MAENNPETFEVPPRNETYLYLLGLAALVLNKIRHTLQGYRTPRTFSHKDIERGIEYNHRIVKEWEQRFADGLAGQEAPFRGRDVLETGPGPDLGTGIILLAKGAASYTAVDKNNLIRLTHSRFYKKLAQSLRVFPDHVAAERALDDFMGKRPSALRYVWDPSAGLSGLKEFGYDLFISRAMLEHVDDVDIFFDKIKGKLRSGARMLHLVDIKSHTRHIKRIDPLNLLRYSDSIYSLFKFNGSPNRLRMWDYVRALEGLGYEDVHVTPKKVADGNYIKRIRRHLAPQYRDVPGIETLSFWLYARQP